jgi:hypothetical protein
LQQPREPFFTYFLFNDLQPFFQPDGKLLRPVGVCP